MSSYLDSLIFGIRDVFDKLGARLPTRTALQFLGAVTLEDDPENRRTIVRVEGGGPATELDGEVTGPASATVVAKVGGAAVAFTDAESGRVELEAGELVVKPRYLAEVELDLPTDGAPRDALVYTVPACTETVIYRIRVIVVEPLTGSGSVDVRVGDAAGDDDYLIDHTITGSSAGIVAGDDIEGLAEHFPANKGYEAHVHEGDEVHVRLTPTGEVTGGRVAVRVYGEIIT